MELPLIARARSHDQRVALRLGAESLSYRALLSGSSWVAKRLLGDRGDLGEAHVSLLAEAGGDYVIGQWGIWRAGGVVVPLSLAATGREWEYVIVDSGASCVVCSPSLAEKIRPLVDQLAIDLLLLEGEPDDEPGDFPDVDVRRRAMILYTSGTTSKPKGVVSAHETIQAQIETLVSAWAWQASDRIPLFLPLHHIHGIINVLGCALWSGATVEPFPKFEWDVLLPRIRTDAYTLFMAVPTIYVKLIEFLEGADEGEREEVTRAFGRMRLMISGSAALPAPIHERWTQLTGQRLLERYGMTEIGMALSNPLNGERRPGAVGLPLPGVSVRLISESGDLITLEHEPGEIQVRGANVFQRYWNRPEASADSFVGDWFRTGDVAVLERGYYRIMGRLSVDIIKSGGYKLSALEIESVLLEHDRIAECAVLGTVHETWGEVVSAVVVLSAGTLDLEALRIWCRDRISAYKIPRRLVVVGKLPRNAMGKVPKPGLRDLFEG